MTSERDGMRVIGIGASAGGIEALLSVLAQMPADLPHAVCVTVHLAASSKSRLAEILDRRCAMGVTPARHRARLHPGCVYVAPPDRHLVVKDGLVELSAGPKENGLRPAVDTMLRSMVAHGPRAVAVILSGALGDGSDGARLVLQAGGEVFVQEPEEALVSGMPERALELVDGGAKVMSARDIGRALDALPATPIVAGGEEIGADRPADPEERTRIRPPGPATGFTCPECHGAMWQLDDGAVRRYRCRIGHSYSEDAMIAEHGAATEAALWSALEVLEERAELLRQVAERRGSTHEGLRRRFTSAAEDADARAELIRRALHPQTADGDAIAASPLLDS